MPDETDELMESFNNKQALLLKKISDYNNSSILGKAAALPGLINTALDLKEVQKQLLESKDPKHRLYALSKMLESAAKNDAVSNFEINKVTAHPDHPNETLNTSQMAVLTIFTQPVSWKITKKYSEQVFKDMTPEEIAEHQDDIDAIQGQIKKVREIYGPEGTKSLPTGVTLENIRLPENVLAWGKENGKEWEQDFVASAEGSGQGVDTKPPGSYQAELLLGYITAMRKGAPLLFSREKKLRNDFKDLEIYFKNKNGVVGGDKAMLDKTREYMNAIVENKKFYSGKNSRESHEETLKDLEESQNWWDLEILAQTISKVQEGDFSVKDARGILYGGNGSGSDDEKMGLDHEGISYKGARGLLYGGNESGSDDEEMGLDHEGISYEDATLLWGEGEPDSDDENYEYDAHDRMVEELFDGEQSSETGSSETRRSSWGVQLRKFAKKIGGHKEEAEKGTTRYKESKDTGGEKFEGGSKSPNNSSGG